MKEKEDCRRMSVETGSELEVIIAALYRRSLSPFQKAKIGQRNSIPLRKHYCNVSWFETKLIFVGTF